MRPGAALLRASAEEDSARPAGFAAAGPPAAPPLVVFDEFTSVVDRRVARVVSAAVAKAIREERIRCRLVAVTCHDDVTEWLAPDWVIDMALGQFTRRCLPRPPIELAVHRSRRGAWPVFARHHYLKGTLSPTARCFVALWEGDPVAFCATLPAIGYRGRWRITRIVTLPDYQGVGIGTSLAEAVAELHRGEGHRLGLTASHPAIVAHCRRSGRWRVVDVEEARRRQRTAVHRQLPLLGGARGGFVRVCGLRRAAPTVETAHGASGQTRSPGRRQATRHRSDPQLGRKPAFGRGLRPLFPFDDHAHRGPRPGLCPAACARTARRRSSVSSAFAMRPRRSSTGARRPGRWSG